MFNVGDVVVVRKVNKSEIPGVKSTAETGTEETYVPGRDNPGLSPYIGYWITGKLMSKPECGNSLIVDRDSRNGVEARGVFKTSEIQIISGDDKNNYCIIHTNNSIYEIERVKVNKELN